MSEPNTDEQTVTIAKIRTTLENRGWQRGTIDALIGDLRKPPTRRKAPMPSNPITKEMVAAALKWGDRRPQYIISPDDLVNRDMYHDANDVEKHVPTLAELCRQLRDDLSQSVAMLTRVDLLLLNHEHDKLPALGPFIYDSRMRSIKILALWPDDALKETS